MTIPGIPGTLPKLRASATERATAAALEPARAPAGIPTPEPAPPAVVNRYRERDDDGAMVLVTVYADGRTARQRD